jgi:hypothetical protein
LRTQVDVAPAFRRAFARSQDANLKVGATAAGNLFVPIVPGKDRGKNAGDESQVRFSKHRHDRERHQTN